MQVIRLLGVSLQRRPLYIIMEYMEKGSLRDLLRVSRPNQGETGRFFTWDLACMGRDIAAGMVFLSRHQYVHRDLAARFEFG